MKKKVLLGVGLLVAAMSITSCGDETSISDSVSGNQPSLPSSNSARGDYTIASVSTKDSFRTFAENKVEKTNKQTEFSDLTRQYVVGDDNRINVKPKVIFKDSSGIPTTQVDNWKYIIDVQILNDDQFVSLGEEDLQTYLELVDKTNCDLDFKETAIGHTFKVVVTPDGLTPKQKENITRYQTEITFDVIDGYNVYNAKELSYMNRYIDSFKGDREAWAEFKTSNGLDAELQTNALIIHDDINVTKSDVPSKFFYNEEDSDRAIGSLRDNVDIYTRYFGKDNQFTIYGNYFTLSFASFPYVTREGGKPTPEGKVISHANLFRADAENEAESHDATCKFVMRDLNLIGNAPKQENTILGGGLIMNKSHNVDALMENNLSRTWFITYFSERDYCNYTINKCKAYDNFNSFIYNWGATLIANDSEFVGAGGPVIIQDHVDNDSTTGEGGSVGKATFTGCKLESRVAGTEGWFDLVGASGVVPQIKTLNAAFTNFNANFTFKQNDVEMLNLISVNKSGSAQGLTTGQKIKGSVKIDDNPAFDFGETNPYLAGFIDQVTSQSQVAPIFQSTGAANAFAYFNGTCLVDAQLNELNTVEAATNPIFQGDYLAIYYQGMCFSFGYYHPTPVFD